MGRVIKCQDPRSLVGKLKKERNDNFVLRKTIKSLKTDLNNKTIENEHLMKLLKEEIKKNDLLLELIKTERSKFSGESNPDSY
jgi:predicted component of type VI protein secretion system